MNGMDGIGWVMDKVSIYSGYIYSVRFLIFIGDAEIPLAANYAT